MHRYNNQDHSMLTARYAVEAIWEVNINDDYLEEKTTPDNPNKKGKRKRQCL